MNPLLSEPTDLDHPLGWLRLAKQTRKADLRRYPSKNEPLSLKRLWAGVAPNLRQPIFLIGSPRSG
ncbi:MAG TPA: sulfotransferase, partial [Anaerolineae bacterium]|nr:sulfotransferase [Anaerolineae bacterium]